MEFIAGVIDVQDQPSTAAVWAFLKEQLSGFDGYCGYRRPTVGIVRSTDVPTFILISEIFGILLIDLVEQRVDVATSSVETWMTEKSDALYSRDLAVENFESEIQNRLRHDLEFFDRRKNKASIPIRKVIFFLHNNTSEIDDLISKDLIVNDCHPFSEFKLTLERFWKTEATDFKFSYSKVLSLLEGTTGFRSAQAHTEGRELISTNDFLQASLHKTFQFDKVQRQISTQLPDGPQRIRGLAGTGKTVILCAKAALAHKEFPDFKILFLFNTQSMYQQIRKRIADYYIEDTRSQPDWEKIDVLHAWGGAAQPGFYSMLCNNYDLRPKTYGEARNAEDPLQSIFADLLKSRENRFRAIYDLVLIDEAQDFPPEIFEVVFHSTKDPKRITWAYDEFQSLKELRIREPADMFGNDRHGNPNIENEALSGTYFNEIEKDFILSNCYRNPRAVLMAAHGTGLGLYRQAGVIDIVGDRRTWNSLGYKILKPDKDSFIENDDVMIERPEEFSHNELEKILRKRNHDEKSLVSHAHHASVDQMLITTAAKIKDLVSAQFVAPEDILVVTLNTKQSKSHLNTLRSLLDLEGIRCITPGIIESAAHFKEAGCVTLTTPYRVKGNEGSIVFVINADTAVSDLTLRARAALFVGITRAMGWCYIYGVGQPMQVLIKELEMISADYPMFHFTFPNEDEVQGRRVMLRKTTGVLDQQAEMLNDIAQKNPQLFIEKIFSSPDLLAKIEKLKNRKLA